MKAPGDVTVEVGDLAGRQRHTAQLKAEAGINRYYWKLRFDPSEAQKKQAEERRRQRSAFAAGAGQEGGPAGEEPAGSLAAPGTYLVKLSVKGKALSAPLIVREDPGLQPPR